MPKRSGLLAIVVIGLFTVAACTGVAPGGGGTPAPGATSAPQGGAGSVSATTAKAAIEAAAHVTLTSEDTGPQEDVTAYTNQSTIATDGQVVALFVGDNSTELQQAADAIKTALSAFGQIKVFTNKNVIVLYAPIGGTDNSAAVEAAVKNL